jgi:hypothetical protein
MSAKTTTEQNSLSSLSSGRLALQFTGSEVQPALSGSAIVLKQGGGGRGILTSHPSAIGYRRQGHVTGGSHGGSGSMTVTIAAVAPEFDSAMNSGADQDETERLDNFGQGAEENPTVAQSQPTSRAQEQVNGMTARAGGFSAAGMPGSSPGQEPTWTPFFNPETDHGHYNPFVEWFGGGGGIPNPTADGNTSEGADRRPEEPSRSRSLRPVRSSLVPGPLSIGLKSTFGRSLHKRMETQTLDRVTS